jgi:hypothetical protein
VLDHPAWQPGQAEVAAAGGAGLKADPKARTRRCSKRAKRTTRRGRTTPPRGLCTRRRFQTRHGTEGSLKAPGGAEGLPQSKRLARLKPLTWAFAPLAGLEPALHGLEVRHDPSAWWRLGASPQVA